MPVESTLQRLNAARPIGELELQFSGQGEHGAIVSESWVGWGGG